MREKLSREGIRKIVYNACQRFTVSSRTSECTQGHSRILLSWIAAIIQKSFIWR